MGTDTRTAVATLAACVALIAVTTLVAEEPQNRVIDRKHTSVPPESRFEIIQSTNTLRTYRLDKFSGAVWFLTKADSGEAGWRRIPAPDDGRTGEQVNYQLLTSHASERDTFLTNVHSGRTWVLTEARVTDVLTWTEVPVLRNPPPAPH